MTSVPPQKSTTVRSFRPPMPIRAAFAVLTRAAPGLAARWAEHIWFTLPRFPARPGEPGGTLFRQGTVTGHTWGDGPPVYLMHGWGGNAAQLSGFVAPLVARGHRVVGFDAPSHGASGPGAFGPRSSSIPEFAAALTGVVRRYGPAHAVIAHSMGACAVAAALCDGLPVGRVALLAPMAGPAAYADELRAALGLTGPAFRRLVVRVERRVGEPMHHFDVPALARAVAMPPALIVHDREDPMTPIAGGRAIAGAWAGSRFHETTGLGHGRLLRDPRVIAEVVDFLTDGRAATEPVRAEPVQAIRGGRA